MGLPCLPASAPGVRPRQKPSGQMAEQQHAPPLLEVPGAARPLCKVPQRRTSRQVSIEHSPSVRVTFTAVSLRVSRALIVAARLVTPLSGALLMVLVLAKYRLPIMLESALPALSVSVSEGGRSLNAASIHCVRSSAQSCRPSRSGLVSST